MVVRFEDRVPEGFSMVEKNGSETRAKALQLILLFGLVSLFGDIIYEGARSVNGPYLKVLGANALAVGFIAGLGEFMGYGVRLLSGYFSDKTKSYWFFTIAGYAMLISVPLLALTGFWKIAALELISLPFFFTMKREISKTA